MSFKDFTGQLVAFVNDLIIPLLFALGFIAVLVGVLRYFMIPGEENLQKGRQFLLWGGIAFVLMFAVWGVVNLLLSAIT